MRFILFIAVAVIIFACSKEHLTTTPKLIFRDVNVTTVTGPQDIRITLDLSDKEGDYTTLLGVRKVVIGGCAADTFTELGKFFIPQDFIDAKEKEGEVVVTLARNDRGGNSCSTPGGGTKADTVVYKFWTEDRAGNKSDTTQTKNIIILD